MEAPERDARIETRSALNLPVVVAHYRNKSKLDPELFTAITQDLSFEGLALISQGPIPKGDVVVGIGPPDDWSVLQGKTLRSDRIGVGFFLSGVHISKILPPHEHEALLQFAHQLEQQGISQLHEPAKL